MPSCKEFGALEQAAQPENALEGDWGGPKVKVSRLHTLPAHSSVLTGTALLLRLASRCQGAGAATAR